MRSTIIIGSIKYDCNRILTVSCIVQVLAFGKISKHKFVIVEQLKMLNIISFACVVISFSDQITAQRVYMQNARLYFMIWLLSFEQ